MKCFMYRTLLALAVIVTVILTPVVAASTKNTDTVASTVKVVGYAAREVTPDTVKITIGVTTQADELNTAKTRNDGFMNQIVTDLRAIGLEKRDMKNSSFYVTPSYTSGTPSDTAKIKGYTVSNSLTVTTKDFDKLPKIIETAMNDGANQMHGLQFYVQNEVAIREELTKEAVQNGYRQAGLIANALGQSLGPIVTAEIQQRSPADYTFGNGGMSRAEGTSTSVEQGTVKISMVVNLTYRLH